MKQTAALGSTPSINRSKRRKTPLIVAAGAAIALGAGFTVPASATPVDPPLLVNGGFEEGDFTGWTLDDPSGFTVVSCPGPGSDVAEGFCAAALGAEGTEGTLTQSFATTPGTTYALSFAFKWDGGTPALFTALVDGHPLFSRVDPPAISDFRFARTFFTATAATTTLAFEFRDDPGFMGLDAVAVTIPEPMSAALVGLGLAGLALTRRRTS